MWYLALLVVYICYVLCATLHVCVSERYYAIVLRITPALLSIPLQDMERSLPYMLEGF